MLQRYTWLCSACPDKQRRTARQTAMNDENRIQHTRITRSKLATTTTEITTTTALQSKVGNNAVGTRKRAALGDVTNAHKKLPLTDVTNAVLKKETTEKQQQNVKRPLSRKPSTVTVKKTTETHTKVDVPPKQTASVVIPKKRPSEVVAAPVPRRTLTQSTSTTSLASKTNARVASRRRAEEPAEAEAPRKKQKVEKKQDWDDLDAVDINDPQMVAEYVNDIFDYMRELEVLVINTCINLDKNDAESHVHEEPDSFRMAHERHSRGLAH
jgi:G2/mitotic-specific cyclin 2